MTRRILCGLVILAGTMSLPSLAQKADLNGTWKLNVARSFMGSDHPFADYQLMKKIEQKGDTISVTDTSVHASVVNIPLPDSTTTMEVVADGKEHRVQLPAPFPGMPAPTAEVTADWQSGTLQLLQVSSGLANYSKQRLFLSEDRKQLIILVEGHTSYGDSEQRLVFDKQS
jgi:hypothetical protein